MPFAAGAGFPPKLPLPAAHEPAFNHERPRAALDRPLPLPYLMRGRSQRWKAPPWS